MSGGAICAPDVWRDAEVVVVEGVGTCAVGEVVTGRHDGRQSSFSVVMSVPESAAPLGVGDQGVYRVTVGSATDEVFLVPIGDAAFEAVFTSLVESST